MHSMQVHDVADEKAERRRRRSSIKPVLQREITLASLDSEASRLVRGLAEPGIMRNDVPDDTPATRVVRWRMNIPGEFEDDDGTPVPEGTPKATGSKPATPRPAAPSRPTTPKAGASTAREQQGGPETPKPKALTRVKQAKPLGRTMSMEERDNFLQHMQQNAKAGAQVFTMPRELLEDSVKQAQKVGFHAASFWREDEQAGDGYIVLGMDKGAVRDLVKQAAVEGKAASPLKTGMAGAAAGAVAMLATLAYA